MKKPVKHIIAGIATLSLCTVILTSRATRSGNPQVFQALPQADIEISTDTITRPTDGTPRRQSRDVPEEQIGKIQEQDGVQLKNPSNIKSEAVYDPSTNEYIFNQKVGSLNYRTPSSMSLKEYSNYEMNQAMQDYWQEKASAGRQNNKNRAFAPSFNVNSETFDKIFGSNAINISLQGSAELIFGYQVAKVENPTIPENLRSTPSFNFNEKVQMNARGTIGERLKVGIEYNTEATFDFENKVKLEYTGGEDDIVKKIEAGNVSLPLSGSLISGSQSLFGIKTEMQFGKLYITSVASQQKGQSQVINVQGGAQVSDFSINADAYEANRHFFLSHYFKEKFDNAMSALPVINSQVSITKMEVWVTNKTKNYTNSRNIIGFMDLGESQVLISNPNGKGSKTPSNTSNSLYNNVKNNVRSYTGINLPAYTQGRDYEKIENARLLTSQEYSYNAKLGFISLNSALNSDEVLAVAYQYVVNGTTYQVGEFSTDVSAPQTLVLKLIKGTSLSPSLPNWGLMMKNIYSLGSSQISNSNFKLNILYQDDNTGNAINYLPLGTSNKESLLTVMGLDRLNSQLQTSPDGIFDYVEGYTINSTSGKIIFPVREPFGSHLKEYLIKKNVSQDLINNLVYQELYDSTQTKAKLIAEKDKFIMSGSFKSSGGSEIMLNAMNIPEGSVKVTASGRTLTEGTDYTVDYTLGRVKIINSGLLESGTPIQVSLENNSLFNVQTKTMVGTHLDYKFNDDFTLGATLIHLSERPLTSKVNYGEDPVSNTMLGLNGTYKTNSQFLTKMVDKLPFIQTKETSSVLFTGEFAKLIPGTPSSVNDESYLDDFESSQTSIDMRTSTYWSLASVPQGQNLFPEASLINNVASGFNRAKLAWYTIDPLFLRNYSTTPANIKNNKTEQESHFTREIYEKEIFPNKESVNNIETTLPILNLAFYPNEKGPYNYDTYPSSYSKGINNKGLLNNPQSRWGGIQRSITSSDFEANNVEYIEFWLMDPYAEGKIKSSGDLYFNLGNVSEDVLKDGRKSFENGLPSNSQITDVDSTAWGIVSTKQELSKGFDVGSQVAQDVGFDGLNNNNEQTFFSSYVNQIKSIINPSYLTPYVNDPSGDDYHYYRGSDYDKEGLGILARYKKYNGMEGNSQPSGSSTESYPTAATNVPNSEDIDNDNTLSETEAYYQYRVSLKKEDLIVGHNFITDSLRVKPSNAETEVTWYQFKVPISDYEKVIGGISDFKSIRFMRMFLRNVTDSMLLRFATLQLIRGEWRKYELSLKQGSEDLSSQPTEGSLDISAVNIEENSSKTPVNYVLPVGLSRAVDPSNPQLLQLNEQSMVLKVNNLADGDAKAAYKTVNLDLRQYKTLKMDMHAEALPSNILKDKELTVFIRIGSDYRNNYYEYEVPIKVTAAGVYNNNSDNDRLIVWPESNRFEISLDVLKAAKVARNKAESVSGSNITNQTVYPYADGSNTIYVCGNPSLSNIKAIMIGVRNPKGDVSNPATQGRQVSGEIWVNELRVSGLSNKGGWAANARMQAKLADLGIVNVSGTTSSAGWGSLESKVNERNKYEQMQYDINTNLELGKFFPKEAGVSIPMYASLSETFINPEYDPLDPDVLFSDALKNASSQSERDSLKRICVDYTRRRSLNFTNVRIQPQTATKQTMPWSISNWSASYGYNEYYTRNINTEYSFQHAYKGGLNYIYNLKPKNVQPFKNVHLFDNKYFRLIKDFNFYYLPSNFSFRTDMQRNYSETKIRDIDLSGVTFEPTISKDFTWNRMYDLKFDLTRSLKFDFSATNTAYIDELEGAMDKSNWSDYEKKRAEIWNNILSMGRTTSYYQQFNVNYNTPINKLPGLDWTSLSVRYRGDYGWDAAPLSTTSTIGNTLKNSNTIQYNGSLNFRSLFNKVPYLRQLDQKYQNRARGTEKKQMVTVKYSQEIPSMKAGRARFITHKLSTKDVKVVLSDASGKEVPAKIDVITPDKVKITPDVDARNVNILIEGKVPQKDNLLKLLLEGGIRAATSLRDFSVSYTQDGATYMPGYKEGAKLFGSSSSSTPGLPFILGMQDENFDNYAFLHNWLVNDTASELDPVTYKKQNTLNIRASLEPITGLKVELQANRGYSRIINRYYNSEIGHFDPASDMVTGNFSMSVWTFKSAFEKISSGSTYSSLVFNKLKTNRTIISDRLAERRVLLDPTYHRDSIILTATGDSTIHNFGYGKTSQDVLLPSFMSAYMNVDPKKIQLDFMSNLSKLSWKSFAMLRPNWRVTYDGLARIPLFAEYVRSIVLGHAYSSSFIISSYASNSLYYDNNKDGLSDSINSSYNYISRYDLGTVSIQELFSPLMSIDVSWKNNLTTRLEFRRSRSVTLSFSNGQVMEILTKEYIFGVGYRFDNLPFNIVAPSASSKLKNDLTLKLDITIRNDKTILRKLVEGYNEITDGKQNLKISFSADYLVSDKVTIRFFYDRIVNTPFVSTTYKTSNTNIGFSVRLQLM